MDSHAHVCKDTEGIAQCYQRPRQPLRNNQSRQMRRRRAFGRAATLLKQTVVVFSELEGLGHGEAWRVLDGIIVKSRVKLKGGYGVHLGRIVSWLLGSLLLIRGLLEKRVGAGTGLLLHPLLLLQKPGWRSQDLRLEGINGPG